jgi:hypothetical protein
VENKRHSQEKGRRRETTKKKERMGRQPSILLTVGLQAHSQQVLPASAGCYYS